MHATRLLNRMSESAPGRRHAEPSS
jgi:hypothetical protein